MTVHQRFIIGIPDGFPLEAAGPVFCAGITMYSPLCYWDADKGGKRVGIVGIGGLGQMGVQLARAMGNTVTAISTSPSKEAAAREIGADRYVRYCWSIYALLFQVRGVLRPGEHGGRRRELRHHPQYRLGRAQQQCISPSIGQIFC